MRNKPKRAFYFVEEDDAYEFRREGERHGGDSC